MVPLLSLAGATSLAVSVSVAAVVAALTVALGVFVARPVTRVLGTRFGLNDRLSTLLADAKAASSVPAGVGLGLLAGGFETVLLVYVGALLVGGLGVAIVADSELGDVLGGLSLLASGRFEQGDWVSVGDVEGRVQRVGLRTTEVRSFDNESVTVPNGHLTDVPVTNHTAQEKLRQTYRFGVGYDEDLQAAMEAVHIAAEQVDGIVADPAPAVRVADLDPSWVTLRARVWLDAPSRADYLDVRSAFIRAVKTALAENDISLNPEVTELTGEIGTVELDADNTDLERPETDD